MTLKYTERTTGATAVTTELNSLADDAAAVMSTPVSNDASDERNLLVDVAVVIATQGSARASDAAVSLLIAPAVGGMYGDSATLETAQDLIATTASGKVATHTLDAATTARTVTFYGIQIPNADFKYGLLNETGQALAGSGNSIYASGFYSTDNI